MRSRSKRPPGTGQPQGLGAQPRPAPIPTDPVSRRDRRAGARVERQKAGAHSVGSRPAWQNPIVLVTGAAVLGGLLLIAVLSLAGGGKPGPSATSGTASIVTPAFSTSTDRADGRALGDRKSVV